MSEQKDILEKRLDELAGRRMDKNWTQIKSLIESYYGSDFAHDVFSKAELYNSSGKNSNYEKMLKMEKERTRNDFFDKIQGIEYFLKE